MSGMVKDMYFSPNGSITISGCFFIEWSDKIYSRYIAPCTQFPYIDLVQASYFPVPLIG